MFGIRTVHIAVEADNGFLPDISKESQSTARGRATNKLDIGCCGKEDRKENT